MYCVELYCIVLYCIVLYCKCIAIGVFFECCLTYLGEIILGFSKVGLTEEEIFGCAWTN